ncbi:MAG: hypothetical protein Crog4KO_36580 [Crocinitomicaceae bacterium]
MFQNLNGVIYLDDLLTGGSTVQEAITNFQYICDRAKKFGLQISPKKVTCGESVEFLGYYIRHNSVFPVIDEQAIDDTVNELVRSQDKRLVLRLRGLLNRLRIHHWQPKASEFLDVASSISNMKHYIKWLLKSALVLNRTHKYSRLRRLYVDWASEKWFAKERIGFLLTDEQNRPIWMGSHQLKGFHSSVHGELLAVQEAVKKIPPSILQGDSIAVFSDNFTAVKLMQMFLDSDHWQNMGKKLDVRICRIITGINEIFDALGFRKVHFSHIQSYDNHVADLLSRWG